MEKQEKSWAFALEINTQRESSPPGKSEPPGVLQVCPVSRNRELIEGRDKRSYLIDGDKVVAATNAIGLDVVLDCEHASYWGMGAPAYGWLSNFRTEGNFIVADASYTDIGRNAIAERHFRYLSPSFLMENSTEVAAIHSVGVVNLPNLSEMQALNQEQKQIEKKEEEIMGENPYEKLLEQQVQLNGEQLKRNGELQAELEKTRAENASLKTQLNTQQAQQNALQCQAMLDAAVSANKLTPAQKVAFGSIGGPAELNKVLEALPVQENLNALSQKAALTGGASAGAQAGGTELNADQQAAAKALGMESEEYRARYLNKDGGKK